VATASFLNGYTVFSNELAAHIGVSEAIIVGRLHYWITKCGHGIAGKKWIYNTMEQWHHQFPFLSVPQLRKIFYKLRHQGLIIAEKLNKRNRDHKLWYTLNYETLEKMDICMQTFPSCSLASSREERAQTNRFNQKEKSYYKEQNKTLHKKFPLTPLSNQAEKEKCVSLPQKVQVYHQSPKTESTTSVQMIKIWNTYQGTPYQKPISKSFEKRLQDIFFERFNKNMNLWENFCQEVANNPFLSGKTSQIGWKADLMWCLKSDHLDKIFSGHYGINVENLKRVNEKECYQDIENEISNISDNEKVKNIRLMLLKHFGTHLYISWFKETDIQVDGLDRISFRTRSLFRKAYIARLLEQISWLRTRSISLS